MRMRLPVEPREFQVRICQKWSYLTSPPCQDRNGNLVMANLSQRQKLGSAEWEVLVYWDSVGCENGTTSLCYYN